MFRNFDSILVGKGFLESEVLALNHGVEIGVDVFSAGS